MICLRAVRFMTWDQRRLVNTHYYLYFHPVMTRSNTTSCYRIFFFSFKNLRYESNTYTNRPVSLWCFCERCHGLDLHLSISKDIHSAVLNLIITMSAIRDMQRISSYPAVLTWGFLIKGCRPYSREEAFACRVSRRRAEGERQGQPEAQLLS